MRLAEIVRLLPRPLIAGQVERFGGRMFKGRIPGAGVGVPYSPRQPRRANRIATVGTGVRDALPPLRWAAGFFTSGSGISLSIYLARDPRVPHRNVVMAGRRQSSCPQALASRASRLNVSWKPPVIDRDASVLRPAQDIRIAMTENESRGARSFFRAWTVCAATNIIPGNHHDRAKCRRRRNPPHSFQRAGSPRPSTWKKRPAQG